MTVTFQGGGHFDQINEGIEDTEHFLLQCHAYESQRRDLLREVFQLHNILNLPNQTIGQILLYGDKSFTHDQSRQILESTLKFIHSSKRFSQHHQCKPRDINLLSHPSLLIINLAIASSMYCKYIYVTKDYTKACQL